jgi:hypothetical protein
MTERPNIRRMHVPERSVEKTFFDPKTEIKEHEWAKILQALESDKNTPGWRVNLIDRAGWIAILDPSNVKIEPKDWRIINDQLGQRKSKMLRDSYARSAAFVKALVPQDFRLNPVDWEMMKVELNEHRNNDASHWIVFAEQAGCMQLIAPGTISISESDWQGMKSALAYYREESIKPDSSSGDPRYCFLRTAVGMHMLDPREPTLETSDWRLLREKLDRSHKVSVVWDFLRDAASLTLLSAERVAITDRGFEITMPTNLSVDKDVAPVPDILAL